MKSAHVLAAVASLAAAGLVAQQAAFERIPNGQLVFSYTGRVRFDDQLSAHLTAYGTLVQGVPNAELFSGEPSEKTARFTVVSTPIGLDPFRVGALFHARARPVAGDAARFRVYFDPAAQDRDFTKPETFTTGRAVAVLRARPWALMAVPSLMAHAEGVLELELSEDFLIQGQRLNFRTLGTAVRIHVHGGPVPEIRPGEDTLFPIGGTGIAADPFPPRAN